MILVLRPETALHYKSRCDPTRVNLELDLSAQSSTVFASSRCSGPQSSFSSSLLWTSALDLPRTLEPFLFLLPFPLLQISELDLFEPKLDQLNHRVLPALALLCQRRPTSTSSASSSAPLFPLSENLQENVSYAAAWPKLRVVQSLYRAVYILDPCGRAHTDETDSGEFVQVYLPRGSALRFSTALLLHS